MSGLPKSFIKKFGVTKKAWAEFRKSRKGSGSSRKEEKGAASMPKKKKATGTPRKRRVRAAARVARRKVGAAMDTRPGKVVLFAAEAAGGAIISTQIVNRAPIVKGYGGGAKALIQAGLGLGGLVLFRRNRHLRAASAGAIIASMLTGAKTVLKLEPLSGPGPGARTLSPAQMRQISSMGMPVNYPGKLGMPVDYPGRLGDPYAPALDAGGTGGWSMGF